MSKKTNNNRFVAGNKALDQNPNPFRKCAHHIFSSNYAGNMRQHDEIVSKSGDKINATDMINPINIKVIIHFLAPVGSYNKEMVLQRAHDLIMSLNDDFNNYSTNPNTMNNFKYKSIINQVFTSNIPKQNVYLGNTYLKYLPRAPSNITFELGEIYYYPVKNRLSLSQYDDIKDMEIEQQVIKQYIHQNRADAINPEYFLNIWVIDMTGTNILGFANFPWEPLDNYHGIVLNRRSFFPEDYGETNFTNQKTATHQVGHYLGLLHVINQDSGSGVYVGSNINADTENAFEPSSEMPNKLNIHYDPNDKVTNKKLHTDPQYNPLFMNFMDYTNDKYVTMFTENQLRKMRYMLMTYRSKLNSLINNAKLPIPKYNPDTDTVTATITSRGTSRTPKLVPSREQPYSPRLTAQGYTYVNQPVTQPAPTQAQVNSMITQLVPNLCGSNVNPNSPTSSMDQIITNIRNNVSSTSNSQTPSQNLQNAVNNLQAYTSANGYATRYPHDPYMNQEYFKHYALQQQNSQMNPQPNIQMSPQTVSQLNQQPSAPMNTGLVEMNPQIMAQINPRATAEMNQHALAMARMNQQPMPQINTGMVEMNPQIMAQMNPQTTMEMNPHAMATSRMNQAMAMNPQDMQYMYPANQMYPVQQNAIEKPEKNEKRKKRVDPQFNQKQPEIIMDEVDDIYINNEAVSNLMNSHTKPNLQTPSEPMTPSELADRLAVVDSQIKNIKSGLPIANMNKIIAQNQSENKYNKHGQLINNDTAMVTSRGTCRTVPKPTNSRIPTNRFVRSKPTNFGKMADN